MDKIKKAVGPKTIRDFEWRFGVCTVDSVGNQSECFIQVKMVLKDEEGTVSTLLLDLSMNEFNEFYREM